MILLSTHENNYNRDETYSAEGSAASDHSSLVELHGVWVEVGDQRVASLVDCCHQSVLLGHAELLALDAHHDAIPRKFKVLAVGFLPKTIKV